MSIEHGIIIQNKSLIQMLDKPNENLFNFLLTQTKLLVLDVEGTIISKYENDYDSVEKDLRETGLSDLEIIQILTQYKQAEENLAKQGGQLEIFEGRDPKPIISPELPGLLKKFKDRGFTIVLNTGTKGDSLGKYFVFFKKQVYPSISIIIHLRLMIFMPLTVKKKN